MEQVSWNDADAFCRRLAKHTGKAVRLPTEAEWEYGCRAGSKSQFSYGEDGEKLGDFAWYDKNSRGKAQPVGTKKPNAWGLYDVHGNVWEWCADRYVGNALAPRPDPQGEGIDTPRVVCGGGVLADGAHSRSAARMGGAPGLRGKDVGFRVCVEVR